MSIDMKTAVIRAKQCATELYEDALPKNLALEEIEFDEHAEEWLVTLGYDSSNIIHRTSGVDFFGTKEEERKRAYKLFKIDANTGDLVSMTIRNV